MAVADNNAVAAAAAAASDVEAGDEFVSVPRFATFIFRGGAALAVAVRSRLQLPHGKSVWRS